MNMERFILLAVVLVYSSAWSHANSCYDTAKFSGGCPGWVKRNLCSSTRFGRFMRRHCKSSCGFCATTDVNQCDSNPCYNGATCSRTTRSYKCTCAAGFYGTKCDLVNKCASGPCKNGASCKAYIHYSSYSSSSTYTCTCREGYSGTNCDINIDDCAENPCENQGTCIDGINSYICKCAEGYAGANCETESSSSTFPTYAHTMLNAHNNYRIQHQAPNMTLDKDLMVAAQSWAEHLAEKGSMEHADFNERPGQGENLAWQSGQTSFDEVATVMTKAWYDEVAMYDFNNPGWSSGIGHFTQVVWKNSVKLGVGIAVSSNGQMFIVARYGPMGNIIGRFAENVQRGTYI